MEKNEKFPRLEMLGQNLSKNQNDLVLYDLLREKNLTHFYCLLKQGYSLDAFLLHCLIDNGFEDHVLKALSLCGRYDDDVYDFLALYLGEEKAQEFFVAHNFRRLIASRFSRDALVKHNMWEILLEKEEYLILASTGNIDILYQSYRKTRCYGIGKFLLTIGHVDFFVSLQDFDTLKYSLSGCVRLFDLNDWSRILSCDMSMQKRLAKKVLGEKCDENDLYRYIVNHGGVDALYQDKSHSPWAWMLSSGITDPFVADKNWSFLYRWGFYHLIDIEDWASGFGAPDYLIRCAIKQKKWDFLERKGYLSALFFHFRWCRWRRCLVKRFFQTKK